MKTFCVIGLGRFGQTLAVTLTRNGNQVMVIDENSDIINAIADTVTNAVVGDPTNEAVLRASGVKNYDCAIVCLSKNVNDSLLVTLTLKDIGVPYIVTRAISDQHKRVLEKIGVDKIIFPEQDMGEKVAYMLDKNNVMEYIEFSNDYSIVELKIPHSWIGKNLIELEVRKRYGVTIIAINNPDDAAMEVSPAPTHIFRQHDLVTLMGHNTDIDKIVKAL